MHMEARVCVRHGFSVAAAVDDGFLTRSCGPMQPYRLFNASHSQGQIVSTRLSFTFFNMVSNPTMQVVYSPDGMLHDPPTEVTRGEAKPYLGNCIYPYPTTSPALLLTTLFRIPCTSCLYQGLH